MASPSVASRSKTSSRIDTDDVILARALRFSAWARRNVRLVIIGTLIGAVLLAGLLYYRIYQGQRAERAALRFIAVEQTVASGNTALAQRDLADFARRYDGTVEADQARLMLARLHLEAGAPRRAIPVLGEVTDDLDDPIGVQGAMLLAAAQSQDGQRDAAIRTYLRVADGAEMKYQRTEALEAAALLRQQAGDWTGAAELYRRLVEQSEEGSFERAVFEMRLAEAQGRAGTR
ncbi:MAG TPA: tetratricopeptide repeat protein [Longimicrobiaceae bacterium]|nr:tetratricopeptide repeat protein [Longimicrobiaceae bacterium]